MGNKLLVLFIFLPVFLFTESKLLLLCGPSGVGKTTMIAELKKRDDRFKYVTPYTTRPLRQNETDKVHMSYEAMVALENTGKLLALNNVYGNYYATPRDVIEESLENGLFPVIDWPIEKVEMMRSIFKEKVYVVYLFPSTDEQLFEQIAVDNRDGSGRRFGLGKEELVKFHLGHYDRLIDRSIESISNDCVKMAENIYDSYQISCSGTTSCARN